MKHLAIVTPVVFVAALSFVLASKPPARLEVDTLTGGDGPATQGMTDANPQPVSIVNWLIDENGNIRVSNQVRDQVVFLIDATIYLGPGEEWVSPWVDARRFNVLRADIAQQQPIRCYYRYSWREGHMRDGVEFTGPIDGSQRYDILGPSIAIRCLNTHASEPYRIDWAALYLRTE